MNKIKKTLLIALEIVFVLLIIYSAYKIYIWCTENKKTSEILDNISKTVTVDKDNKTTIDFTTLRKENNDTVAYISVKATNIHYPVVKANNNEFYLNHSFDKSESGAGWIFADYRNKVDGTDKNLIIYGHNRRDGSMFGTLKNTLNKDWYENKDNRYITLNTNNGDMNYEVFSIYQIAEEDYYLITAFDSGSFATFVNELKQRSIKDFGVEINEDDSILTLSTCANDNNYRVVVHARKIR